MSGDDWMAEQEAEAQRTVELANTTLGMTEQEVRALAVLSHHVGDTTRLIGG